MRGDDHDAGARVFDDADMARPGVAWPEVEEDQVAGLFGTCGDALAVPVLSIGGAWDGDVRGAIGHHRQAGAVEGVGAFASEYVRLSELSFCIGDDFCRQPTRNTCVGFEVARAG